MRRMLRRLSILLMMLSACGRQEGGDPLRIVPADVGVAAVAPSLSRLQARTVAFLDEIEGSRGVLDLLADRFGLDLRTPEGPASLGLDSSKAFAIFSHGADRAWALLASVADRDVFVQGARARLEKGAGARLDGGDEELPEGQPWRFAGPGSPPAWRAALGVTTDRVAVLVLTAPDGDPVAHYATLAKGPDRPFTATERFARAKTTAGEDAVVYLALEDILPEAPASLGLARGLLQTQLDALPRFEGGLAIPEDPAGLPSLTVQLAAERVGEGALPVHWVTPDGSPEGLARVFPKTTTAFVRVRAALGEVRKMPGFIRDTVLPDRLPGFETLPLPGTSDLIELVEGDLAFAVLGLDDSANLARLAYSLGSIPRLMSVCHVALAARHRGAEAARRTFSGISSQLATSGWTVAPIEHSGAANPYVGWSWARDSRHYSVLIDDEVIVFIVGPGEVDGFLAVKDGRALSLASFAEGTGVAVSRALGQRDATPFGVVVSPLRLSRELAARGLPPYFLKIINDVRLFAGGLGATERRLEIALEVAL